MKILKDLIACLLSFGSCLLIYFIASSKVIPFQYQIIVIVVVVIVLLLLLLCSFQCKKALIIISINIFSILWLILLLGCSFYFGKTEKFLDNITSSVGKTEIYYIFVRKDSYQDIKELIGKKMLFASQTLENSEEVLNLLKEKLKSEIELSPSLMEGVGYLLNKNVESFILSSSYYDLLRENDPSFLDNTTLLMKIELNLKENTIVKDVNVQTEPFIVYISGIDTGGSISKISRSDVNIIVAINPITHKILLVTTPRDYYVQLYGTTGTKDKLTHAGIYGVEKSVKTLEWLYEIDINYYLRTNFSTLIKVVDAIGPISVYSNYDFYTYSGAHMINGYNTLNSELALEFARTRKTIPGGDDTRGINQEAIIEGIIKKVSNPIILMKYTNILDALTGSFQTNMPSADLNNLIKMQLNNPKGWIVESISVTGTGARRPTYSMGSQSLYVSIPDDISLSNAKKKIIQHMNEK